MSLKRKLESDFVRKADDKILKWNSTELEAMDISDISSVGGSQKFNFELTDKKVKTNLLKSAKRAHFEVETKQNCINLRFSHGAYLLVAKKMIDECQMKFSDKSVFTYGELEIKVDEFRSGRDLNNKHLDTKVIFSVNNLKVVMHCYNSTQNIKIDGTAHSIFVHKFLEPLFTARIYQTQDEIELYDRKIVTSINGTSKGKSIRKVRSTIIKTLFNCKKCNKTFESSNLLTKHKAEHTNTNSSILHMRNSTGNNSTLSDHLLCEDA